MSDDDETIYPTHRCFDDVTDYLNELAVGGATYEELNRYRVVHGIIAPDGEAPHVHAWLERDDGRVFQWGIYKGERIMFSVARDEYIAQANVIEFVSYSIRGCLAMDRVFGPGPWKSKYRVMCADYQKREKRSG